MDRVTIRRSRPNFGSLIGLIGVCIIAGGLISNTSQVKAQTVQPTERKLELSSENCLECHEQADMYADLPSGEQVYLTIDPQVFAASVHGQEDLACSDCHVDISEYPHPTLQASTRRELTVQQNVNCIACHEENQQAVEDSVHQRAADAGDIEAAVCSDCHGAHDTSPPAEPRSKIPHTCQRCHSEIYDIYQGSVHGAALLDESNPDVPTCIDCHGVHNVEGPSNGSFHLFSPQICASCHADESLMAQYDISTDVFDTYVADFHGTTVILFEALAPDQQTNKPVCIDCHGVHDMVKTDDPQSHVIPENLLATCQRCHPDAVDTFPRSWLSHYVPSWEKTPLVYMVNLFYAIIIPLTIVGMMVLILADVKRRISHKIYGGGDE
ncbi:MAG: cytochrome c3 family protein [Anaerolineae bacterium]|nr:cytochrome c3 family protein [Anaerolineae bacterium]